MRRTTILNAHQVKRMTYHEAETAFYKHCTLKNLRPRTMCYYTEDLNYFQEKTAVKYIEDVTQVVFDDFIFAELEAGKKVTSLNTRIRGLRVFFKFCAEREYMEPVSAKLMKEDVEIKEPYTEAELRRLLKKPKSNRWTEWRTWAAINYLIGTGNRASTVMSRIFTTTLRLNLDNEEDRRAWKYLQHRDRKQYRSYSSALVAAVNDHFSRQERLAADPFLETLEWQDAFLQEVKNTIREAMQTSGASLGNMVALLQRVQDTPQQDEAMSEDAYDTAMEFISSL